MLCLSGFELYSRWVPLRDQNTAAFSEKHYERERFREFSRSHSGLRQFTRQCQEVYRDSETNVRSIRLYDVVWILDNGFVFW